MYHPNPKGFFDSSAKYGPIGAAVVFLSNLEFAHDNFILAFHKKNPKLSSGIRPYFPRQFTEKVDYLICAISMSPELRRIPVFNDGSLNLLWLQYQLDELYEIRSALAHGSLVYSRTSNDGASWRLDRVTAVKKRSWGVKSTEIGSSFLADVCTTAQALKIYLSSLEMSLEQRYNWEDQYKSDCEIRRNHVVLREMVEVGLFVPDNNIRALMSLYDGQ